MGTILEHGVVHAEGGLQAAAHQGGVKDPTAQAGLQRPRLVSAGVGTAAGTETNKMAALVQIVSMTSLPESFVSQDQKIFYFSVFQEICTKEMKLLFFSFL